MHLHSLKHARSNSGTRSLPKQAWFFSLGMSEIGIFVSSSSLNTAYYPPSGIGPTPECGTYFYKRPYLCTIPNLLSQSQKLLLSAICAFRQGNQLRYCRGGDFSCMSKFDLSPYHTCRRSRCCFAGSRRASVFVRPEECLRPIWKHRSDARLSSAASDFLRRKVLNLTHRRNSYAKNTIICQSRNNSESVVSHVTH